MTNNENQQNESDNNKVPATKSKRVPLEIGREYWYLEVTVALNALKDSFAKGTILYSKMF